MNTFKKISLICGILLSANIAIEAAKKDTHLVKKLDKSSLIQAIAKSKKIVVVDVFATWCSPCKLMGPIFEEVAAQLGDNYEFVKVDFDEVDSCVKEYKVTSVPTIIVFKDGKELGRSAGYKDAEALKAKIEEIAQGPVSVKRMPKEQLNQKLFEAIQLADITTMKELIEAGADVNAQYEQGTTPVILTIAFAGMHHEKSIEMLKILLDAGASLDFVGPQNPNNESLESMVEMMINNTSRILETFKQMDSLIKERTKKSSDSKN
ncbi:MAG: thioredoxin [Candidatus Dependentiae bacterium]